MLQRGDTLRPPSGALARPNRTLCAPVRGFPLAESHAVFPRPRARPRQGDGGIEGDCLPVAAKWISILQAAMPSGRASASPMRPRPVHPPRSPDPPSREAREPLGGAAASATRGAQVACPNLAYPVPRSPDAPLALFAARKMLQKEKKFPWSAPQPCREYARSNRFPSFTALPCTVPELPDPTLEFSHTRCQSRLLPIAAATPHSPWSLSGPGTLPVVHA